MAVKGVDLSEFNGDVDFRLLQENGIQFVILRSGFGSDYPGQQDSGFVRNMEKAIGAGMPWGVYHYAYATTEGGGRDEAAHCLRLLQSRRPPYGVWYDMEEAKTLGGDLAGAAQGFCGELEGLGLYVGVYANLNWWENHLTHPVFDRYDRWCAQYNSSCDLAKPYGMWQFTDSLVIGGKNFDGNWAYKNYPALSGGSVPKPTTKSRVLQTIGNKLSRGFGNGHDGVDLCWDENPNEPIIAHSDGVVGFLQTGYGNDTESSGNASYGNCVKLKHPNGYATLSAHLDSVRVGSGESVQKGQVIGTMGNTGNSYGNHLHFEVHNANGTKIDPAPYLNADLPGLPTADPTPAPETPKEEPMSYQEFCKMMAQYEQEKQQKPESDWSVKEGWWAKATTLGLFDRTMPRNGVTREQLAAVLGRAGLLDGSARTE